MSLLELTIFKTIFMFLFVAFPAYLRCWTVSIWIIGERSGKRASERAREREREGKEY